MISFESKLLYKLIESGGFYSKILDLEIDGKHTKVLPKDLQYDPVSDNLIHFDFLKVQENTKVSVEVPVNFLNQDKCPGLKKGGVLNIVRRLVELICNANNIPEKLDFDLIDSDIGDAVKISNISLPENVQPSITDRDFVIATLVPPTVEAEPEEKKEEAETPDGEEKKEESKEDSKSEKKEGDSKPESQKTESPENKPK